MPTLKSKIQNLKYAPGFTLVELLIVMTILSILAAMTVVGLAAAVNDARITRTRAIVNKIDILVGERWEGYRTKSVALRIPPGVNAFWAARIRLYAIREIMRMELPDRISDVTTPPIITGLTTPALTQSYRRLALRATNNNIANWTTQHEGAECLYLILSTMKDHDKSALDYFSTDEIGDVDGDGMKEILDAWGHPVAFLRWAPGFSEHPGPDGEWGVAGTDDDGNGTTDDIFEAMWYGSDDLKPVTSQTRLAAVNPNNANAIVAPDPYDPLRVDPRVCGVDMVGILGLPTTARDTEPSNNTFDLRPLVFSAGPDGTYDVNVEGALVYRLTDPPNDPYYISPSNTQPGLVFNPTAPSGDGDVDGDGNPRGWADNITNHAPETAPQ